MSLPIRRYSRGGILTEGRRSRGHRAESTRDDGTRFTQLRNTCSRTGPTAACLELSGRFRVVTMSCGCASRAPRIRLIKVPGSRVSTESPSRNTRCLTTEYYIAMYVKDPPMPNLSSWIRLPSWAFTDLTPGIDLQGSGYLSRLVRIRLPQ